MARRRGCTLALAVGAALLLAGASASASVASACRSCQGLSLWGASFGNPAPWRWAPITAFERMVGKRLSLVGFGAPFANCTSGRCSFYPFPRAMMSKIRRHGAIPVLSWGSESLPDQTDEPGFDLGALLGGRYDGFIRRFARAARSWRHPFFLRFDWEMNGNWFPWGVGVEGNTSAQFVAAWRHVHHIFQMAGARNVAWVWCPDVGRWANLRKLYPGNAYVDWTCLDGYNWGTTGRNSPGARRGGWMSFNTVYRHDYREIVHRIAPAKPMIIGEVGSSSHGGSKSRWISSMFHQLPREYPQIRGFLWYQVAQPTWDFRLEPGTAAARAFSAGISEPLYAAGVSPHARLRGSLAW